MKITRSLIVALIVLMTAFLGAAGPQTAAATEKNEKTSGRGLAEKRDSIQNAADAGLAAEPSTPDIATTPTITGRDYTDPVTGMEFVFLQGGCYQMGDTGDKGNNRKKPVHEVCVDDFYMGRYEVTQGQWNSIKGGGPITVETGMDFPAYEVSWRDAEEFAFDLQKKTGVHFRLPTEAEWEYAARSGGRNDRWPGTDSARELKEYAWCSQPRTKEVRPVGLKKPNSLGLFDMAGNVKEWVSDWYDAEYHENGPKHNPGGPRKEVFHVWSKKVDEKVLRGGSYDDNAGQCQSTARDKLAFSRKYNDIGFRLAIQLLSRPSAAASIRFQPPIDPGSRVSIKYSGGKDTFKVIEIRQDGMVVKAEYVRDIATQDDALAGAPVRTAEDAEPLFIRYIDMEDLEVSVPRSAGQGAGMGVWRGAVLGAASGLGSTNPAMVIIGANWGLFAGAVLNAGYPGKHWEEVAYVKWSDDAQKKDASAITKGSLSGGSAAWREQESGPAGTNAALAGAGKGLYLGFFFPYTILLRDHHGSADYLYINNLESGAGLGVRMGFGFTEQIALEGLLSTTWHATNLRTVVNDSIEDQPLTNAELEIKWRIPLVESRFKPYISGGIGYHWLSDDFDMRLSHYQGSGTQAGFGTEYRIHDNLWFTAGLTGKRIVFDSGEWSGVADVIVDIVTIDIGLTQHFK